MKRILNFGSLNIDTVYNVSHIVRPGETIACNDAQSFCGGKGLNQSVALSRAGSNVYHAGIIGEDGAMLKKVLIDNNINCEFLRETDAKSGNAIIQVEKSGQNSIILFGGTNQQIDGEMIESVLNDFDKDDILVCQNEISGMDILLKSARQKGMKIVLNPSPMDSEMAAVDLSLIDTLVINEIEGEDITGEKDPDKICDSLLAKNSGLKIVLTIGKDGVIYKDAKNRFTHGIFKVKVLDTTGAGDTFLGYFTSLTADGKDVQTALKIASAASSIAVSKKGAVPSIPALEEVMSALDTLIEG